jgi:Fe-S cluster biogenesis protein NfuA
MMDMLPNVDGLIAKIRASTDPETSHAALELVQTIMEFHARGIDRMMEIASERGDAGWAVIEDFGRDPLVSNLLLLHNLHPLDTDTRVRGALEKVRPYLHSHGGDVQLVGDAGQTVRLRMVGSCNGCPSSSLTLKNLVEKSIFDAAPEVSSIEYEGEIHGESPGVSISRAAQAAPAGQ